MDGKATYRTGAAKLWLAAATALLAAVSPAFGKTDLISAFREVRIDPTTLTTGKVFHVGDVVLRVALRRPPTVRTSEARTIDLYGFMVTVPKGTVLQEDTYIRAPDPRIFSKRDGVGTPSHGSVFCSLDRIALGPFTSGSNLAPFKAVPCLLDTNADGIFDGITFIGQFSAREAGPLTIDPLPYNSIAGDFPPTDHVDMMFVKLHKGSVVLKPFLYDLDGRHKTIRMYTTEHGALVTDYSWGCLMTTPSNPGAPAAMLGATVAISDADPVGQSFRGTITKSGQSAIGAQVSPNQLIFDWLPSKSAPCGDWKGTDSSSNKLYGSAG